MAKRKNKRGKKKRAKSDYVSKSLQKRRDAAVENQTNKLLKADEEHPEYARYAASDENAETFKIARAYQAVSEGLDPESKRLAQHLIDQAAASGRDPEEVVEAVRQTVTKFKDTNGLAERLSKVATEFNGRLDEEDLEMCEFIRGLDREQFDYLLAKVGDNSAQLGILKTIIESNMEKTDQDIERLALLHGAHEVAGIDRLGLDGLPTRIGLERQAKSLTALGIGKGEAGVTSEEYFSERGIKRLSNALSHQQDYREYTSVTSRLADEEDRPFGVMHPGSVPLSRLQRTSRKRPEEATVDTYMTVMRDAFTSTRQRQNNGKNITKAQAQLATRVWYELKRARIFHIDQETYIALHIESDRYTTEVEAGFEYRAARSKSTMRQAERDAMEEEAREHNLRVSKASRRMGYPEKLPFPTMFIGYAEGCPMSATTAMFKAPSQLRDKIKDMSILGHLMTADGFVVEFLQATIADNERVTWYEQLREEDSTWAYSMDLAPWILNGVIKIINDHRTFIVETDMPADMRKEFKRGRKDMGLNKGKTKHVPPPYYTLKVQSKLLREKVRTAFPYPRTPASYRTDVRGHERCRIQRGPIPIDPKVAKKLAKRGYKLFTTNELDAETYRRLSERNLAYKRSDEWMAIKVSWVNDYMSNSDESLPYVPAVRKLASVNVRPQRTSTGSWADDPRAR